MSLTGRKGKVKRDLTQAECNTEWCNGPGIAFHEGEIVYEYKGHTYGCIRWPGIAVSREPGETPFMEIPHDEVEWDDEKSE